MPVAVGIKDVGILASFTRWGWPWHGLCTNVTIAGSGKTIPQPLTGNAWLIDKGLPAIVLNPAEVISEAAANREWRNYGLISGGVVNGTQLPNNAYIHIDADGINWLVTVAGSFPSANVARLTLSIMRFGHFEIGPATPAAITKTVDVACEAIELSNPAGGPFFGRGVDLFDVWTNGTRALACVFMYMDAGLTKISLFSAIEISLSGSGGAAGSTLVLTASEVKGQSALTTNGTYDGTNSGGNYNAIGSGSFTGGIAYGSSAGWGTTDVNTQTVSILGNEVSWNQTSSGYGAGYPVVCGYVNARTDCRLCQYDSSGLVVALRLKYSRTIDHWFTGVTPGSLNFAPNTSPADGSFTGGVLCKAYVSAAISIAGEDRIGYYLLQNNTVVDKVEHVATATGSQQIYYGPDPTDTINYPPSTETPTCSNALHSTTTYSVGASSWSGAICGTLSTAISIDPSTANLLQTWQMRSRLNSGFSYFNDGVTKFGIHRSDNVAAFFLGDSPRTYGTVATPLGDKTTSLTVGFYFSWQRKTGAYAFSANPICYV